MGRSFVLESQPFHYLHVYSNGTHFSISFSSWVRLGMRLPRQSSHDRYTVMQLYAQTSVPPSSSASIARKSLVPFPTRLESLRNQLSPCRAQNNSNSKHQLPHLTRHQKATHNNSTKTSNFEPRTRSTSVAVYILRTFLGLGCPPLG